MIVTFAPAARLARNFGENFALGIEYYTGLGPLQNILAVNDQQHNVYAVIDFKIGRWEINAGIGYGLTQASDRWMGSHAFEVGAVSCLGDLLAGELPLPALGAIWSNKSDRVVHSHCCSGG